MVKRALRAVAMSLILSCEKTTPPNPPDRVELRRLSGDTLELIPQGQQLPYCLVFTVSESTVVRQLTMNRDHTSVRCDAGKPIRGTSFRIPANEGKVRIFVILSDRRLNADSIGQQVLEFAAKPDLQVLDLRLPGRVVSQILEFGPEATAAPAIGDIIIRSDAGAMEATPDGGN